ncbi:hypothetical protein ON010_g12589 [Phytophthora cinnamomi]|nr:hypothetical protein ON010_g12589 [Phytophthora cinnamomi]
MRACRSDELAAYKARRGGHQAGGSSGLFELLKKQGLEFQFGTKVTASEVNGDVVKLTTEPSQGGDASSIESDTVLVATCRRAYTTGLGLEQIGIQTDKLGRVDVDDAFRTQVPGIFATGDVIKVAHKAEEEGVACVENIADKQGHVNYGAIPDVIYTFPGFASVGRSSRPRALSATSASSP